MKRRAFRPWITCLLIGLSRASADAESAEAAPPATAVIRTGVSSPTRDKPQSKLWYAQGHWWAWLPVRGGSAVWKRTDEGWQRDEALAIALAELPGQADVWADDAGVRAILVEPNRLTLVSLRYDSHRDGYCVDSVHPCPLDQVAAPRDTTETATLARDGTGQWWIAYDRAAQTYVRAFNDGPNAAWSEPVKLGEPIKADDVCAIAALPECVGVVWSDQLHDAVYFAAHRNGDGLDVWQIPEVVEQGRRTADDHVNLAVGGDGTLFVASKNSVDRIGEPQLVLRVRRPSGAWQNFPYAVVTTEQMPSRPIVQLNHDATRLRLLHSVYPAAPSGRRSYIAMQTIGTDQIALDTPAGELLATTSALNNVTGCKQRQPDGVPAVVFASDAAGNVYEAVLPQAD